MKGLLCSTGALIGRPNGRDYRLLRELAKELTCDGFEFMMYDTWYEKKEEMITVLKEMSLFIPVLHAEKSIGELISEGGEENFKTAMERFEINCDIAKRLGATAVVLHLWSGIASDRNFVNNLQAYSYLLKVAKEYGQDLLIENVVCNHENPMKHLKELAERYPEVHFVFDTKMAEFHKELELLYTQEYEWLWKNGHIQHYHVNDYKGGVKDWKSLKTLPVGEGQIDFECFFEFVHKTGYDGMYTVESTAFDSTGVIDVEMLNKQFAKIRRIIERSSIEWA